MNYLLRNYLVSSLFLLFGKLSFCYSNQLFTGSEAVKQKTVADPNILQHVAFFKSQVFQFNEMHFLNCGISLYGSYCP